MKKYVVEMIGIIHVNAEDSDEAKKLALSAGAEALEGHLMAGLAYPYEPRPKPVDLDGSDE